MASKDLSLSMLVSNVNSFGLDAVASWTEEPVQYIPNMPYPTGPTALPPMLVCAVLLVVIVYGIYVFGVK